MNNKGFGIEVLFIFILLVAFTMISFYAFIRNVLQPIFHPREEVHNCKNEYRIYMKNHQIDLNK